MRNASELAILFMLMLMLVLVLEIAPKAIIEHEHD